MPLLKKHHVESGKHLPSHGGPLSVYPLLRQVWSRFVTVEREGRAMKAMAPVFDMFNHDPNSSTVHGFQESNQVRSLPTCNTQDTHTPWTDFRSSAIPRQVRLEYETARFRIALDGNLSNEALFGSDLAFKIGQVTICGIFYGIR